MSDRDTLRLERDLAADPSDAMALEALAAARTRAGRGWSDEPLPLDLRCSARERGVYVWTRHGLGLELVRVPEVPGDVIRWVAAQRKWADVDRHPQPAFYVGRYPVTLGEWREFMRTGYGAGRQTAWMLSVDVRDFERHPVVNVTHADAVAFCSWAGLRLPSAPEWTRAALGDEVEELCACGGRGEPPVGHRPPAHDRWIPSGNFAPRRLYPWGNEAPTPERCVAAELSRGDEACPGSFDSDDAHAECSRCGGSRRIHPLVPVRGTRPVREANRKACAACVFDRSNRRSCFDLADERHPLVDGFRPARPDGASPCGAHDMVGHVFQWVAPTLAEKLLAEKLGEVAGTALGGSFDGAPPPSPASSVYRAMPECTADDVGFRVALSAQERAL